MKVIGIYEARTHFSRIVEDVERGETFTITRHGVPVADIVPRKVWGRARQESIEKLRNFNTGRTPGMPIRQAIEEGRPQAWQSWWIHR